MSGTDAEKFPDASEEEKQAPSSPDLRHGIVLQGTFDTESSREEFLKTARKFSSLKARRQHTEKPQ